MRIRSADKTNSQEGAVMRGERRRAGRCTLAVHVQVERRTFRVASVSHLPLLWRSWRWTRFERI